MAEISEDLYSKIRDFQARKGRDYKSMATSLPAALSTGSAQEAMGVARQFYGTPEDRRIDPLEKARLKKELLELLAETDKNKLSARLSAADKLKNQNDVILKALEVAGKVAGDQATSNASAADSLNRALATIDGNFGKHLSDAAVKAGAANVGGVSEALGIMRQAMTGTGEYGELDPGFVGQFAAAVAQFQGAGDFASLASLQAQGDLVAQQKGFSSVKAWMEHAAGQGGGPAIAAAKAAEYLGDPAVMSMASKISEEATLLIKAEKDATALKLVKGGANVSKTMIDTFEKLMASPELAGQPGSGEDVGDQIDSVLGDTQQGAAPDAIAKLLEDLDKEDLPEASNLAEARRRLLSDPAFLEEMKRQGFQDPGMFLKEAKRRARAMTMERKAADRQRMQGAGPETPPPPVTAKAANASATVPAPTENKSMMPPAPPPGPGTTSNDLIRGYFQKRKNQSLPEEEPESP
jgi:hypothetical protein